jgi:glutaredoxin
MTFGEVNSESGSDQRLIPLGRILFGAGIVLLLLRGVDLFTRMPGLPPFWYANQPMWIILGLILSAIGWQILWGHTKLTAASWRPKVSGRRFNTATLYVRKGCHLCDEAAELLTRYEPWIPAPVEVDIDADAKLAERFCTCVPVVMLDGKIRFRGKINEALLRRLIEGTPPVHSPSRSNGF